MEQWHYNACLDLHGFTMHEAEEQAKRFVAEHPHSTLMIMHGDGTGKLRNKIRAMLKSGALPCREYFPGEDIGAPGSYGVTMVFT